MTRIAFRAASSYTAGFRTAEQPGPKNPATSESLMGSHGVGLTKVHLHGRGPNGWWRIFQDFSLASKAAGF